MEPQRCPCGTRSGRPRHRQLCDPMSSAGDFKSRVGGDLANSQEEPRSTMGPTRPPTLWPLRHSDTHWLLWPCTYTSALHSSGPNHSGSAKTKWPGLGQVALAQQQWQMAQQSLPAGRLWPTGFAAWPCPGTSSSENSHLLKIPEPRSPGTC